MRNLSGCCAGIVSLAYCASEKLARFRKLFFSQSSHCKIPIYKVVRRLLAAGLQRRHWTILPKRLGGFSRWQLSYADTMRQ
ncbi:MAG TPA: hypothetical protein DDW84_00625 [Phycisphaerales bacterium]|nr:MAG: hypothetical protein A2Y13_11110 [Planctomycetes bacterium GWC2_45_44]HBG77339.1 hypothetical protein [Phycisphaerales bacterium]HBR19618.1 hypothetical protein [Phycisphaerales bacterium]